MKLLDSITHSVEMNLSNLGESGGQGQMVEAIYFVN